jgi:hypothetical protein
MLAAPIFQKGSVQPFAQELSPISAGQRLARNSAKAFPAGSSCNPLILVFPSIFVIPSCISARSKILARGGANYPWRYRPDLDLEKPILEPAARCDRLCMAGTIKIGTNLNFIDGTD